MHENTDPAAELAQLDFFAGDWEGDGGFLATPVSPAITQAVLRAEAGWRYRGHWLEQRFTWVERPAADADAIGLVEAVRMWGYDRATGRFVSEWFDNRGRRASVTSDGWDGDRLVATTVILAAGREIPARETFTRRGADAWHHSAEVDFGEGWVLGEEQTLRRIKG